MQLQKDAGSGGGLGFCMRRTWVGLEGRKNGLERSGNAETVKDGFPVIRGFLALSDVGPKLINDRIDERMDLTQCSLHFEGHRAIIFVPHKARDIKAFRNVKRLVAEPNPLNMTAKNHFFVINLHDCDFGG